jgi:NADPH:quinone reductase-like Zn-dependent oxidoreductase
MAKAMGARVFATAGSAEKVKACEELGAERGINYREEDYVEVVRELTAARELTSSWTWSVAITSTRRQGDGPGGRHVSIAFQQGAKVEFNFMPMMLKRLTFTGSVLRSQPTEEKARIARNLRETVWPMLDAGTMKPLIYKNFPPGGGVEGASTDGKFAAYR